MPVRKIIVDPSVHLIAECFGLTIAHGEAAVLLTGDRVLNRRTEGYYEVRIPTHHEPRRLFEGFERALKRTWYKAIYINGLAGVSTHMDSGEIVFSAFKVVK